MVLERSLEEYESVKRWLLDLSFERSGSGGTRSLFLWVLKKFSGFVDKSPDEMVSECKGSEEAKQGYADRIKEYVMKDGRARGTISMYSSALKSFFKHNGVEVPVGKVKNWVTYEDRAITPEELRKLLEVADLRTKVALAILAQSGMRLSTLAGLTYGHVREGLEKDEVPLRIHIASRLAKDRVRSFDTFIGQESKELLKAYLETRTRGTEDIPGEVLTDESPLLRDAASKTAKPIKGKMIYLSIRNAMLKAGLVKRGEKRSKLRPHSLRKFFRTELEVAGVSRTFIEYMMGHTLPGTDEAYFRPSISQVKEAYMKGVSFLSLTPRRDVRDEFKRVLEVVKARREDPEISKLADRFLEALGEEKWIVAAPSKARASNNASDLCSKCKNPVGQDALVCDQCGARLRVECKKCKALNRVGAKFCKNCGKKLQPFKEGLSTAVDVARKPRRVEG